MPLIIDGHNLIGADPDIQLEEPEDEVRLLRKLEWFSRKSRRQITVYFDRGQVAGNDPRAGGQVSVRFSRSGVTADAAIIKHLRGLRGEARNSTVVTSDRQLQTTARELGARVQPSAEFLSELNRTSEPEEDRASPAEMTAEELEEWLRLFKRGREQGSES